MPAAITPAPLMIRRRDGDDGPLNFDMACPAAPASLSLCAASILGRTPFRVSPSWHESHIQILYTRTGEVFSRRLILARASRSIELGNLVVRLGGMSGGGHDVFVALSIASLRRQSGKSIGPRFKRRQRARVDQIRRRRQDRDAVFQRQQG